MKDYLIKQYEEIRHEVDLAAEKAGRNPDEVKLIAVSKTFPIEDINVVYDLGQRCFGENKVQELVEKHKVQPEDIEWHLIGHLQGNKAARAVKCAAYIHSVDSLKLLERLERLAGEAGRKVKILLEANISGEESKFGADDAAAMELATAAAQCQNLEFCGLMTMAPWDAEDDELHQIFGGLRKLRDRMEKELNISLPELSMGMSGDFHIAIAEGATMVRIGSAIFGKRDYQL